VEVVALPDDEHTEEAKLHFWQSASGAYRHKGPAGLRIPRDPSSRCPSE
jgi:hypothetical protein